MLSFRKYNNGKIGDTTQSLQVTKFENVEFRKYNNGEIGKHKVILILITNEMPRKCLFLNCQQKNKAPRLFLVMTCKILAAFDFDHTLIDTNSDTYVFKLAPNGIIPESIRSLYSDRGWTKFMGLVFRYLYEHGISDQDYQTCLKEINWTKGMKEMLITLQSPRFETIIISDANSVFIDYILKVNNLQDSVAKVFTNPAKYDANGCLTIDCYHVQDWCELSTINLCKGHILDTYIDQRKKEGVQFSHVAYIGDGTNDLCPALTLGTNDIVFPRKEFQLQKKLRCYIEKGNVVNAKIVPWSEGGEILEVLQKL